MNQIYEQFRKLFESVCSPSRKLVEDTTFWAVFALLAILTGLVMSTRAEAHGIPDSVMTQASTNVFKVTTPGVSTGTGLWITPNLVMTNCHVAGMDRDTEMLVTHAALNVTYRAKMVLCDETRDLAILKSYRPNLDTVPTRLAALPAALGDEIYTAGYGFGYPLTIKRGLMQTTVSGGIGGKRAMIMAGAAPGDSGSPVWDDHGNLVGVLNSGLQSQGIPLAERSFAVSLSNIRSFLTGLLRRIKRGEGS